MHLLAFPFVAFVLLFAIPREAFSEKGSKAKGFLAHVGHACMAGAPGCLLAWACPQMDRAFESAVGLTALGVLASSALLLSNLIVVRAPAAGVSARQAAPAPVQPASGDLSPRLWERALAGDAGAVPRLDGPAG